MTSRFINVDAFEDSAATALFADAVFCKERFRGVMVPSCL